MCIREHKQGSTIQVRITPRAATDALTGRKGDVLGIRLKAPPAEGRANQALIKFLAKKLHVASSSITILRGHGSREKVLLVEGVGKKELEARLEDQEN
jgi:uncharacterized protein (TIGR00251 family)